MTQLLEVKIDTTTTADVTLAASNANQSIRLYQLVVIPSANTNITFKDGSTALSGAMTLAAGVPLVLPDTGTPWASSAAGNGLIIAQSTTAQLSGRAYYRIG
jgi:hypothetical protein